MSGRKATRTRWGRPHQNHSPPLLSCMVIAFWRTCAFRFSANRAVTSSDSTNSTWRRRKGHLHQGPSCCSVTSSKTILRGRQRLTGITVISASYNIGVRVHSIWTRHPVRIIQISRNTLGVVASCLCWHWNLQGIPGKPTQYCHHNP